MNDYQNHPYGVRPVDPRQMSSDGTVLLQASAGGDNSSAF